MYFPPYTEYTQDSCNLFNIFLIKLQLYSSRFSHLTFYIMVFFSVLHKYMYLPPYTQDEDTGQIYQDLDALEAAVKHGGSYCPWCNDLGLKGQ